MAKLVFKMNQSLDAYVDHQKMGPPGPGLFRHYIELVRGLTGMVYGRRMYKIMRYWDDDLPDWDAEEREYTAVWRSKPKWVAEGPAAPVAKISRLNKYAKVDKVGMLEINWELGLSSDTFGNEKKCKAMQSNASN